MMNWRSRFPASPPAIRRFRHPRGFHQVGGFPDIPLMEDIVFPTACAPSPARPASATRVRTSGRRWEKHGLLNTIVMMWRLRLRFHYGADPQNWRVNMAYAPAPAVKPLMLSPSPSWPRHRYPAGEDALIPHLGAEAPPPCRAGSCSGCRHRAAGRLGPVTLWCARISAILFRRAAEHASGRAADPSANAAGRRSWLRMQCAARASSSPLHADHRHRLPVLTPEIPRGRRRCAGKRSRADPRRRRRLRTDRAA